MYEDEKVEMLLKKESYIIDLIPKISNNKNYFDFENFYLNNNEKLNNFSDKIENILLKLYCYCNFEVYYDGKWEHNIEVKQLIKMIKNVIQGKNEFLNILINDTLIQLNSNDLYMTIHNPNDKMLNIMSILVESEGLFLRKSK